MLHNCKSKGEEEDFQEEEENPTLQRNVIYDRLYITFCYFMSFRRKRASFYGRSRRENLR
jgi:hypothetical protein